MLRTIFKWKVMFTIPIVKMNVGNPYYKVTFSLRMFFNKVIWCIVCSQRLMLKISRFLLSDFPNSSFAPFRMGIQRCSTQGAINFNVVLISFL